MLMGRGSPPQAAEARTSLAHPPAAAVDDLQPPPTAPGASPCPSGGPSGGAPVWPGPMAGIPENPAGLDKGMRDGK